MPAAAHSAASSAMLGHGRPSRTIAHELMHSARSPQIVTSAAAAMVPATVLSAFVS